MSNQLANPSPNAAFMLTRPTVDERNRLQRYMAYLDSNEAHWSKPDLAAYRDYLLANGLKSSTVRAYVVTVRQRYKDLLTDNAVRDMLYTSLPDDLTIADKYAAVSEQLVRIANAVNPKAARVKVKTVQDKADSHQQRLTPDEGRALMNAPGLTTLRGIRDSAIITLMLCTGLRREEVCNLVVSDLYQKLMGEPALLVQEGKAAKQRLVIYGEYREWVVPVVEFWFKRAGITDGAAFRTLKPPQFTQVTTRPMSVRSINDVFNSYAIGDGLTIAPHDTRRTYAKWLRDAGMPMEEIKRQLGHKSIETTDKYIGDQNVERRKPTSIL